MIPFEKALDTILSSARSGPAETTDLDQAPGRILAEDIKTDRDIPACDFSAMDGYACRREDLERTLKEIEIISAGKEPEKRVGKDECSRIMTGAVVPEGADTVVMFEHSEEKDGVIKVVKKSRSLNIRFRGEDLKKGDLVLKAGARISPIETAVLASVGCDPVPVFKQVRVGIIATGDELVEPKVTPVSAQIRNSNSLQLAAQVRRAGGIPIYYGIARDQPEVIDGMVKKALTDCDVILLSGGVSMGDFDYVPGILKENGIDIQFHKVAMKPGKPVIFGIKGKTYFFGMPGNPVSTYVVFEFLVRPFLMKMMGNTYAPVEVATRLADTIKRKKTDRREFRPVRFNRQGQAAGFDYHGSAHIHAYTRADGVVVLKEGVAELEAGSDVAVLLIQ